MMSLEVGECETPWFPGDGSVDIRCPSSPAIWNGAVLLECDRRQACRFAGRFLSMDPPETVDDVVRDVLGELANMIGGNLKCILSHGNPAFHALRGGWQRLQPAGLRGRGPGAACFSMRRGPLLGHGPDDAALRSSMNAILTGRWPSIQMILGERRTCKWSSWSGTTAGRQLRTSSRTI